ncbi:hypothetical protein [Mesorhizobium comanense]|uniref:hypothetical protein n=1 Tax=Mesorhizobium comanense TaxID=2502215 RepID=UPI0010F5E535|nr:hypothetical protein [Mesorhizobium comanense]
MRQIIELLAPGSSFVSGQSGSCGRSSRSKRLKTMQDEPGIRSLGNEFSTLSCEPGNFCPRAIEPKKYREKIALEVVRGDQTAHGNR